MAAPIPGKSINIVESEESRMTPLQAWFFGDQPALKKVYPKIRQSILDGYAQDSQCGTWEKLADVIYPGGMNAIGQQLGKRSVRTLEQKRVWAKEICPHMDVENNRSPSFQCFRDGIRRMGAE